MLIEVAEEFHNLLGLTRVEVAGGLIGEQKQWLVNHRPRHAHQLLLSAGKLAGIKIFLGHDLKAIESVRHKALALASGDVFVGKRQIDVFLNG